MLRASCRGSGLHGVPGPGGSRPVPPPDHTPPLPSSRRQAGLLHHLHVRAGPTPDLRAGGIDLLRQEHVSVDSRVTCTCCPLGTRVAKDGPQRGWGSGGQWEVGQTEQQRGPAWGTAATLRTCSGPSRCALLPFRMSFSDVCAQDPCPHPCGPPTPCPPRTASGGGLAQGREAGC